MNDPFQNRRYLKIIIIGESGSGKTAFLNQYINKIFSNTYQATIGASFIPKTIKYNENTIELQFWDTSGQERFQSLGGSFYRGADACILTYDITNKESFNNLAMWKSEFLLQIDFNYREDLPFIVIGTKLDLQSSREVAKEEAQEWCKANRIPIELLFETSSKTGENVAESINAAIDVGLRHSFRKITYNPGVIDVTDIEEPKYVSTCCK